MSFNDAVCENIPAKPAPNKVRYTERPPRLRDFCPAVLFSPDDGSYLPIRSAASCPIYGISESRKLIIEPNFRKIGLRY